MWRSCVYFVQAALMDVVPSAVAALDADQGNVTVATYGICFLLRLAPNNQVTVTPCYQ